MRIAIRRATLLDFSPKINSYSSFLLGSIVFNYPDTTSFAPQDAPRHHSQNSRERFPSFDSMASTGSFHLIANAPSQPSPSYRMSPRQQIHKQPPPVQLLPYAQRRKLMQEREKQGKERQPDTQQQQERQPYMQMPMYSMQPSPYGHPRPQMPYPMDSNQYGMPYMVPGPPPGVPMGPTGVPMGMGTMPMGPPVGMVPQQQAAVRPPSSGRSKTPPPGQQPSGSAASSITRQQDVKRKQHLHHSLPPSGLRGRASSTDSMEAPPPRPQRRDGGLPPPPPPPPPPQMNQYHTRTDSSGSISSIGSHGSRDASGMTTLTDRLGNDIAGYLQQETPETNMDMQQLPQQGSDGFFGFLTFSPSSKQSKGGMSVEEFHRRNQEFLQQSEQQRNQMQRAVRDSSPHRQYVL